ncbi:hypothetical protein XI05_09810 [Bradyrhizobium sp. CCBAU 11357]|nr:hypothetical protein [Bradyrhizobium sp. CCBAU 11357]
MMSNTSTKNLRAIEIHDVASAWIVGATQMLQKLVLAEITQDSDFAARIGPRDLGELVKRETQDA